MTVLFSMADPVDGFTFTPHFITAVLAVIPNDSSFLFNPYSDTGLGTTYAA
jgi:hypothetical protein